MNENNERWMGESVRNVQKRESGVSTKQMNLLLNNAGNSGDHMGIETVYIWIKRYFGKLSGNGRTQSHRD